MAYGQSVVYQEEWQQNRKINNNNEIEEINNNEIEEINNNEIEEINNNEIEEINITFDHIDHSNILFHYW